jgi:hypothetical protein
LETGAALAAEVEYKFEINGEPKALSTTVYCFDRVFSELEVTQLHHFPNFTTALGDELVVSLSDHEFIAARNGQQVCSAIKTRPNRGEPARISSTQKSPAQIVDFWMGDEPRSCAGITIYPPVIKDVSTVPAKDFIKPAQLSWFRQATERGMQEPSVVGEIRARTSTKLMKASRC